MFLLFLITVHLNARIPKNLASTLARLEQSVTLWGFAVEFTFRESCTSAPGGDFCHNWNSDHSVVLLAHYSLYSYRSYYDTGRRRGFGPDFYFWRFIPFLRKDNYRAGGRACGQLPSDGMRKSRCMFVCHAKAGLWLLVSENPFAGVAGGPGSFVSCKIKKK